jgi:hypothetical protein
MTSSGGLHLENLSTGADDPNEVVAVFGLHRSPAWGSSLSSQRSFARWSTSTSNSKRRTASDRSAKISASSIRGLFQRSAPSCRSGRSAWHDRPVRAGQGR